MAANDLPPGMPSLSDMQQLMASLAQMQYMMLRQSQAQGASRDEQQPPLETAPKAEEGAPESQLAQADEDNVKGEAAEADAAEADAAEGHVEDNMEEVKVDPAPEKASHPVKKAEYENETPDQPVKTIYKRVGWYTIDKNAKLEILARIHERPKKKENDDGHGVGSVRETLKPTPKVKTTVPEPEGPPPRLRLELAQKNLLEYYHHNLSFFATCRPRRSKREKESDRSGRRSRGSGSGGQGSREKRHRGQYD